MLKFSDYKYERPNIEEVQKKFNELILEFKNAESLEKQVECLDTINKLRSHIDTMMTLVSIRYSINTTDEFYDAEQNFFDENAPLIEEMVTNLYKELVHSKFRRGLEEKFGKFLFDSAELQLKTFNSEIIPDLQEENKLNSEYSKLKASAKIMFEGQERNLSEMGPFTESKDRDLRRRAQEAVIDFYRENEEKFDDIYDRGVKVRHRIAKKLGYDNFIQLAYDRFGRTDYNPEMVANYRKQVLENLVPLSLKLREKQAKRLGLDSLKYYDQPLAYLSGNATPKGDPEWIIAQGKKMYEELSPETNEFINFMLDRGLMDLVAKKGKDSGGYCTYISEYKSPFIFSNFNGTSGDVDVLTHEAGHAFQVYCSRGFEVPEYMWPTLEACEIHSMSMEFLTYPWMENFFKEDVDKYKYNHLSEALLFIPYGVTVDEFQHRVYENPDMTPAERKAVWREVEKKYLPKKDYEGNDFLERGGFWFRQGHIFSSPFYYIDYTLAQVCAFQFYNKSIVNREKAWEDYLRLCKTGGSKPFLQLLEVAEIKNPFVDGTIKEVVKPLEEYLDSIDDSKF